MFLEVRLGVVDKMLQQPAEEDRQSQQHEDAGNEPCGEGCLCVLSKQLPNEEREEDEEDDQVDESDSHFQQEPPVLPTGPVHAGTI